MITQLDGQKPPQELSIEEVLTRTFELYSRKFAIFLIPVLIASLTTGIISIPLRNYVEGAMADLEPSAPPEVVLKWFHTYLPTLLCMTAVVTIISLIVNAIAHGICIKFVSNLIEKGNASLEEAFHFTVYKLFSLLVVTIITGILTALGFIALVVPGIILAIMFSLVVQVVIVEDVGALDSLSRSRRLVSNRWLKTFVLLLIVYAIILFVSFVGSLIGTPFGGASLIVSSIIAAFVQPILPISLTVYYYSMLAKEEQLRVPPPPPPF